MPVFENRIQVNTSLAGIRQATILETFTPNTGGQQLIFRSQAHEKIIAGGNSSGKSFCGTVLAGYSIVPEKDKYGKMTGKTIHPYMDLRIPTAGIEGWISTWSQDSQRDTLRPLFDKILAPYYSRPPDIEDGVIKRMYFEGNSWINCKWQTQGLSAYRGPKKNWIYMDEPHQEQIYKEARSRLFRSGGYMWICLTPIVDPNDPQKSQDVIWMRREIIEPYHRDPDKFPLRHVIYVHVEENYKYVDIEFINGMLAGMSAVERQIRSSGSFAIFTGRNAFNQEMLMAIRNYLEDHPEETACEYGTLRYDMEDNENWKIKFEPDNREYFPDEPSGEYTIKIWEHPIPGDGLQLSPGYTIAVDVAEGVPGGDYTSAHVFRNDNRYIVAALHGHLSEDQLAVDLSLLGNYYNTGAPHYWPAKMAIEVRNYGQTTQKLLLIGNPNLNIPKYPGHRFYYRPTSTDLSQGREYGYAPGWDTNSQTRKFVIMAMREAIMRAYASIASGKPCSIPDPGIINEAFTFVQNKKGKYEGHPDDRLFDLGIGNIVLDTVREPELPPQEPEPEIEDSNWLLTQSDSGLYQVQFNMAGILDKQIGEETDLLF